MNRLVGCWLLVVGINEQEYSLIVGAELKLVNIRVIVKKITWSLYLITIKLNPTTNNQYT
jgi:hypothetical protein